MPFIITQKQPIAKTKKRSYAFTMDINLEYYKIFYYVGKKKSITLAAEELAISQPAVSQAIKHLAPDTTVLPKQSAFFLRRTNLSRFPTDLCRQNPYR